MFVMIKVVVADGNVVCLHTDVFELIFVFLTKNETFDVKGNVESALEIAEDTK